MYTLFENYQPYVQPHRLFPEWDFVRRNVLLNLEYVLKRLHERPTITNRSHPIANILYNIGYGLNNKLDEYMKIVEERIFYLTIDEEMTSTSSYGKLFNGIFYGNNTKELIIVDNDSDFNYREHIGNWKYVSPLKVINSNISDFSYLTPDGRENWKDNDYDELAVFSLDIKKLAFVYYMWNKQNTDNYKKYGDEALLLDIHHLMAMIILPNVLISQLDMIVFNRLKNYYYGRPMSRTLRRQPFTVKDLTARLDLVLHRIITVAQSQTMTYETLLTMIPAITTQNMYEFLMMPDLPLTRQLNWAYAAARSSTFRFIIELGGVKDIIMNERLIVNARVEIRLLKTDQVLKAHIHDNSIFHHIKDDINFIYNSLNQIQNNLGPIVNTDDYGD